MAATWWEKAVLKARAALMRGEQINLQSRQFWLKLELPSLSSRRIILSEARRLIDLQNRLASSEFEGTLADAATGAGITSTDTFGPYSNAGPATIFWSADSTDAAGNVVTGWYSTQINWNDSRAVMLANMLLFAKRRGSPPIVGTPKINWDTFRIQ